MNIRKTNIEDLLILIPNIIIDNRGFFYEDFVIKKLDFFNFYQQNISSSFRGVIRGMHYQLENTQAKIISALNGSIFDVVVDLRKNSPTFGHWFGITLSSINNYQLYIPRGFAHGFLSLEDNTRVIYKVDNKYNPSVEITINWNDPSIGIIWPDIKSKLIISKKDQKGISFNDFQKLKNKENTDC